MFYFVSHHPTRPLLEGDIISVIRSTKKEHAPANGTYFPGDCRLQRLATEVGCLNWLEEKENTVAH